MMKRFVLTTVSLIAACSASSGAPTSDSTSQAVTGNCATPVIVDRSLFVSSLDGQNQANPFGVAALADFSFQKVMNQIIATGAQGSGQTAVQLYDQMLDTLNTAPGDTNGPHCTGTINGFAVDCPRPEGVLATTNPFKSGKTGFVHPVALVNRFDLAPTNGANCGQYRVVYAIDSAFLPQGVSRFLMIFEATMPNPSFPQQGLAACLPITQLWDSLSANGITTAQFAADLDNFYFKGIAGLPGNPAFPPVVTAQAYGIGGPSNTNTGQIRVNMLSSEQWQLREFTLSQSCAANGDAGSVCTLTANNTFVKDNPFGALFEKGGDSTFQTEFVKQVKALAGSTIPLISMKTPNVDNAGQSSEQDNTNDYSCHAGFGAARGDFGCGTFSKNTSLGNAIQTELTSLGSTLTPADILQRATTQSCAGCHQVSPGTDLGGGLTWPASQGFTQVNESGAQSSALTNDFLPFRSTVMTKFINRHCGGSDAGTADEGDGTSTIGGQQAGSSN